VIEQATEPARRRPVSAPAEHIAGVKVLVVDDETDTREATVLLLQQYGAHVTGACSANEAVAAFERDVPDIVISDIAMPGEDGYSLIHRLRAAGYGARALALTAYAGSEDRKRILAAGYDAYLTKPIAGAELVGAVAGLTRPRGNEEKEG
jgi:CheY-like chemotaxis protein